MHQSKVLASSCKETTLDHAPRILSHKKDAVSLKGVVKGFKGDAIIR